MQNIPNIRKIGKEFYGEDRTCTKLRRIQLKSMGNLVEWWTTRSGQENEEFLIPNLHRVDLIDCPKLKFLPYPPRCMLWFLKNSDEVLPQGGFGNISSSTLPFSLTILSCSFSRDKWNSLHHLPTLEIFEVQSCSGLRALPEAIRSFTSLRVLYLWSLKDLKLLPEWFGNLTSLEKISIRDCPVVTYLPESMKNLTSLKVLWLQECKGLEILPEWLGQLSSLQEFNINRCTNLKSLPKSIRNLTALKELYIWDCPSLVERCKGEDADMISHIREVTLHKTRGMKRFSSLLMASFAHALAIFFGVSSYVICELCPYMSYALPSCRLLIRRILSTVDQCIFADVFITSGFPFVLFPAQGPWFLIHCIYSEG